jgi:hypothetical protein
MQLEFLARIAASPLPMAFTRREDIDRVRLLRAAGLVIALVPMPDDPYAAGGPERAAQVLAVTEKGRQELAAVSDPAVRDEPRIAASALVAHRMRQTWNRVFQAASRD